MGFNPLLATVADVDAITEFETLYCYPNAEVVDFCESGDLQSARKFCDATKQIVLERIAAVPDVDR